MVGGAALLHAEPRDKDRVALRCVDAMVRLVCHVADVRDVSGDVGGEIGFDVLALDVVRDVYDGQRYPSTVSSFGRWALRRVDVWYW